MPVFQSVKAVNKKIPYMFHTQGIISLGLQCLVTNHEGKSSTYNPIKKAKPIKILGYFFKVSQEAQWTRLLQQAKSPSNLRFKAIYIS